LLGKTGKLANRPFKQLGNSKLRLACGSFLLCIAGGLHPDCYNWVNGTSVFDNLPDISKKTAPL
jgi:hypothetical protein